MRGPKPESLILSNTERNELEVLVRQCDNWVADPTGCAMNRGGTSLTLKAE